MCAPENRRASEGRRSTRGGAHVRSSRRRHARAPQRIERLRNSLQSSGGDGGGGEGRHLRFDEGSGGDAVAAGGARGGGGDATATAPALRVRKKNKKLAIELGHRSKRLDHMRSLEKRLEMQNQNSRKGNTRRRQRLK